MIKLNQCISQPIADSLRVGIWNDIKDLTPKEFYNKGHRVKRLGLVQYKRILNNLCLNGHFDRRKK